MPNWIKTAIPVFKFGHNKFKNRKVPPKTDQNQCNIVKELINLYEEKAKPESENFSIDIEDLKKLEEEFLE